MPSITLKHPKQCLTCPWRVEATLDEIPDYDADQHRDLGQTCNQEGLASLDSHLMACHYSKSADQRPCIGWLIHAVGDGNNIIARLYLREITNTNEIETFGDQHTSFAATLRN